MNKYNNNTSIRFDEEIKPWLYRKMQAENRSLGNLVNTILKREKDREEKDKNIDSNFKEWSAYIDALTNTK
jgi:hypothetical protein